MHITSRSTALKVHACKHNGENVLKVSTVEVLDAKKIVLCACYPITFFDYCCYVNV